MSTALDTLDATSRHLGAFVSVCLLASALTGCAVEPAATTTKSTTESTSESTREALPNITAIDPERSLDLGKWETVAPGEHVRYNQRASLIRRGRLVYQKYCTGCHGEYGDGRGAAAVRLITQPRDFTKGIYKFRSTDSGSLPLESDLYRTITRGLARVSMPAFRLMPEGERVAVVEYIKTFYPAWDDEKSQRVVVPVPHDPGDLRTEGRVLRGRIVYLQMGCGQCHGTDGRGTGATQTEYTDAWGNAQAAFDFTRGALKGGNAPEDVYRTFHTGLRSIMPAFGGDTLAAVAADSFAASATQIDASETARLTPILDQFPASAAAIYSEMSATDRLTLAERNSWDLVSYILSLRQSGSTAEAVLGTQ